MKSPNTREKRDNKPRFSISFIRKHPGLFIGMYVAFFADPGGDVAVRMLSRLCLATGCIIICLMVSSFSMSTHATAMKISTCRISAFAYNGERYNTRFVPAALVEVILNSPVLRMFINKYEK
ncbi:YlaC family protein [Escherichia coli]